jgi:hypothetical protein
LQDWQTNYGYDVDSKTDLHYPSRYANWIYKSPEILKNTNFNSGTGWWWTYGNEQFGIKSDPDPKFGSGNCLEAHYSDTTGLKEGNWGTSPLPIKKGSLYLLTYAIKGTKKGHGQILSNLAVEPYTSIILPTSIKFSFDTQVKHDTLLFEGNDNEIASFIFTSTNKDGDVYIDNVSIKEIAIDTSSSTPYQNSPLLVNTSAASKKIALQDTYMFVDGTTVGTEITIPPFSSVILKKKSLGTDLKDQSSSDEAYLFPNPVCDVLNFKHQANTSWALHKESGQTIKEGFSNPINMSDLPDGLYVLKLHSKTYKILKQSK